MSDDADDEALEGADEPVRARPRALVDRIGPLFLAIASTIAHGVAWRLGGLATWKVLGVTTIASALFATWLLHRRRRLVALLRLQQGDLAIGALAALVTVGALYGVARAGFHLAPARATEDLRQILLVFASLESQVLPIVGLVLMAPLDELIWRGAIHESLSDARAGHFASIVGPLLFAATTIPSRHPGVVAAALVVGVVTQITRAQSGRLAPAIVAHAFFGVLVVKQLLPELWSLAQ